MNYIKKLLILLVMQFIAVSAYAASKPSAKPTIWEIVDATPKKTNVLDDVVDATNLNDVVEATGRKLDYDRTPVDNKVYKTRVNPRIPANKAAIGSTAMKKLLKVSGWGYVAVEGVKALLEGIDWVMDPESQSIWRNKVPKDDYSCSYNSPGNKQKKFQAEDGFESFCPYDVALRRLEIRIKTASYQPGVRLEFVRWDPALYQTTTVFRFVFNAVYPNGATVPEYLSVPYKEVDAAPLEKEFLTEDALADYMLGTHPDFKDQKYKDKLPKPNTWTGVAKVFKPENKFEEENSPTVKIAQDQLDKSLPESEDNEIKPKPDPEGGASGFSLPSFCSWATTVCEHIEWLQSDDDLGDDDDQEPDTSVLDREFNTTFSASGSCPPNVKIPFPPFGDLEIGGDKICAFFGYLKYGVLAACSFAAMMIIGSAVRGT